MDFATALDRVGTDLTYRHGWSAFPNVRTADGWDADQICKHIWDTTDLNTPATLYSTYQPELREAYGTIHRHVYLSHALTTAANLWGFEPLTQGFEWKLARLRCTESKDFWQQHEWLRLLVDAQLWELADVLRMWSDAELAAQPPVASRNPDAVINGGF